MAGSFLDMQAYVGITKHIGGFPATKTLLSLCHVEDAREILEVGCGIGVGPAHAAREGQGESPKRDVVIQEPPLP